MLVGAVLAMSAAPASAESVDRASSTAFIADVITLDRTLIIHHTERRAAANAFVNRIASTCPDVLANVLRNETAAQASTVATLYYESEFELGLAYLDAGRAPVMAFVRELGQLRWSRPKIARAVAAGREELLELFALEPPDFCADVSASVASKFASVPSDASRFLEAFKATQKAQGKAAQVPNMIRPFLTGNQLKSLTRLKKLEAREEVVSNADINPAQKRLERILSPS